MCLGKQTKHSADLLMKSPVRERLSALVHAFDKPVTHLTEYAETRERNLSPIAHTDLKLRDRPRSERAYWRIDRILEYHDSSIKAATGWDGKKRPCCSNQDSFQELFRGRQGKGQSAALEAEFRAL